MKGLAMSARNKQAMKMFQAAYVAGTVAAAGAVADGGGRLP